MVGLVVPSNSPDLLRGSGTASESPFVIAARVAGIKVVPSIINAIVLTSAWSSGNSNMLAGSRVLYGMAKTGHAPKIFMKMNRFGVAWVAVAFYGLFMCLGYMTLSSSASTVFEWLQDIVSIATLVRSESKMVSIQVLTNLLGQLAHHPHRISAILLRLQKARH